MEQGVHFLTDILFAKFSLIREIILSQKQLSIKVSGTSMEPTVFDGEKVVVEPIGEMPRLGDVLLFDDYNYQMVLHRIIEIRGNTITLCGDNAKSFDVIDRTRILGKMVCKESKHNLDFTKTCQFYKKTLHDFVICAVINSGELIRIEVRRNNDGYMCQ